MKEVLHDLTHLLEREQQGLEETLTFTRLTRAVHSGRSPGLDGLSAEFYKSFWNILGEDVYNVLLEYN